MKRYIDSVDDLLKMLDSQVDSISWDEFYRKRNRPAPFVLQNKMPDENLVDIFEKKLPIKTALEWGCGEGRNAIYMASKNIKVTAIDISSEAIANARKIADLRNLSIDFRCDNVFNINYDGNTFDLVYDSGMFHHLAPHRRLSYLSLLKHVLKPTGYFALTCFAWGENCADEVGDWEYYHSRRTGVAFAADRLKEFFGKDFNVIEIRKYKNGIPNTIQGLGFMWTCLFQNKL